ncbi:MAG: His/Gly/Thr/Pro-type tRNA ligase C-terminal domain-containing protein [Flavobacteriaceae bacterium]
MTVDHQTLEDQTVTLRHRDSMAQERLTLAEAEAQINEAVSFQNWLGEL